jgi:hypothetical protein
MSNIQAVIFDSAVYDTLSAMRWLKQHSIKPIESVDRTQNYLRYRVNDPKIFKHMITKQVSRGIKLVVGFKSIFVPISKSL